MVNVQWNDSMSVGVEEIDAQHKTLLDMLNTLHEAISCNDPSVVPEIMERMKDYARMHFSTEERFMRKSKYPGLLEHMTEHAFFVSCVKDFNKGEQDPKDLLPALLVFLRQWFLEHILNVDAKMGSHIKLHENMQRIIT